MFVLLINYIYNNQSSLSDTNQNNAASQLRAGCNVLQWIFSPKWRGQMDMKWSEWLDDWLTERLTEWVTERPENMSNVVLPLAGWLLHVRLVAACMAFVCFGPALLWSRFSLHFLFIFWSSLALIDQLNSFVNNFGAAMTRHKERGGNTSRTAGVAGAGSRRPQRVEKIYLVFYFYAGVCWSVGQLKPQQTHPADNNYQMTRIYFLKMGPKDIGLVMLFIRKK